MGDPLAGARERVQQELRESARVKLALAEVASAVIPDMAQMVVESLRSGGKVVFFGNGGSAGDAQHLAAEFIGRFRLERQPLAAIALTTNTSVLTAIGNDYDYDQVFVRQVEALVGAKDVVVGISTSGSSRSVLYAMHAARKKGARCFGFTGQRGSELEAMCDICLMVPSADTAHIQECHIAAGHALCGLVEQAMLQPVSLLSKQPKIRDTFSDRAGMVRRQAQNRAEVDPPLRRRRAGRAV